jgi:hypothetical protein
MEYWTKEMTYLDSTADSLTLKNLNLSNTYNNGIYCEHISKLISNQIYGD